MKYLYGLNNTVDDKKVDGDELDFLTSEVDDALKQQIDNCYNSTTQLVKSASLPVWLLIIKFITLVVWISVLIGVLKAFGGHLMVQNIYENAPYLFYIFPIAFVIWLTIMLYERSKKIKLEHSEELEDASKFLDRVVQDSITQLELPGNAIQIDVLAYRYNIQNDKMKLLSTGMTKYVNISKKMYVKDDALCISDIFYVISIPLSEIKVITPIDKKILLPSWNKEVPANHEDYKKYKIRFNQYRMFFIKSYYVIKINHNLEDYELLVPNYDIDKLLLLTQKQISPQ